MDYSSYLSPELSVLIPVLYLIGVALKKSAAKDWLIPFLLGGVGILLAGVYIAAAQPPAGWQDVFNIIFAGITQGILAAASAVYANNLVKQYTRRGEE